nr:reverse transcriptase domain-containing protein [Tanacetum cinerariifolium]
MDDEPMWAGDSVVTLTLGSGITIPEIANEFAIKDSAIKHSYSNDDTCFGIDVIDEILEDFDALLDEGSKILHSIEGTLLEEEIFAEFDELMAMTADEIFDSESDIKEPPFEKITINTNYKIKKSLEEPPTDLELKPFPDNLDDESFAMIQNKVPPKLGDPESFLIPCNFSKAFSCNALADLGASINLMPYSLYAKLSLETLKPTKRSVRLANRSFKHCIGIAENMLVEVGKFTFSIDFVIIEMKEDNKVPLILGRPFLFTADAVIRVKQKHLNLGVETK